MSSIEAFELDDNCIVTERFNDNELGFGKANRLTHLRLSFWSFDECVYLLTKLDIQLHSFTVTIGHIFQHDTNIFSKIMSVSKISCT